MAKNTYFCPCGRSFPRSTDAVCTGIRLENYSEEHGCWGCCFPLEVRSWDSSVKGLVLDHYVCRASKGGIIYKTTAEFNLENTNCGYVYTLDRPVILQLIRFYLTLEGQGSDLADAANADDDELERYFLGSSLHEGKRTYAFSWKSNKTGLRDKRIFFERYLALNPEQPEDWWREKIQALTPLPAAQPKQCPHYRGVIKKGREYLISCEKWLGPGTPYETRRDAQLGAEHRCLCAEQYQSCLFYRQAERDGEKMSMEYPLPGEGMCPCYGGASAKKGGGHLIRCGKWESPLPDDGTYLQQIKMCSGEDLDKCRFYLLWWLRENGHGEEAGGKSDGELRNIYRGYQLKKELAEEKETGIQPAPAAPASDKPEHPRSPEELAVAIGFYKAQTVQNIIEIGRCLIEAKAQLDHGQWIIWLAEKAEIGYRQASRFMQLANEFGSNVTALSHLSYTKALALLAVPAEERDEFIEVPHVVNGQEKTVEQMTRRELEKAIKERDEARQQAEVQSKEYGSLSRKYGDLNKELADARRTIADKEKALRELESRPVDVAVTEPTEEQLDEMRAEIRRELEREIPQNMYLSSKAAERAVDVFNSAVDAALGHLIEVEQTRPYLQASKDMEDAITWLEVKIERLTELRDAMLMAERRRDEHANDIDF